MTTLLEKALEKVAALPRKEQDAIAAQILIDLEDEALWRQKLQTGSSQLNALARAALAERERGETTPLEDLL